MEKSKILIVENESIVAMDIESSLKSLGYEVTSIVDTGEKADKKAERDKPDIVLMDIRIKGEMDGIEAAESIWLKHGIPVVFLMAYLDEGKIKREKLAMPFGYIVKPIQEKDLEVTIEMALYAAKVDFERKKIEDALRDSENKMRSIFRVAPTGIGMVKDRVLQEVNRRICEMVGYTKEELIGKSSRVLYPSQEEYDFVGKEKYRQIAESGIVVVETRWQKKDRTLLDILLSSIPINANDQSKGISFTALDITQRKTVEKALRKSEEKHRLFFENSPIGIIHYNQNGIITNVNEAMIATFGSSYKKLIGLDIDNIPNKEFSKEVHKSLNGDLGHYEGEYTSFTGKKTSYIKADWIPIKRGGEVISGVGIVEDITEQRLAEKTLRESEEKYKSILENIEDGYFEVNIAGNITFFNDSFCKIIGISKDELVGVNYRQYMDEEATKKLYQAFNRVYTTGESEKSFDLETSQKAGGKKYVETSMSLRNDSDGQPIGFRGIVRDVTKRKQAENALQKAHDELEKKVEERTADYKREKDSAERANQLKNEFLANISHELRNPMHHILSYSKYGVEKINKPKEKLWHYFNQTRQAAERLMLLLNDLLDLSKMESGRMDYKLENNNVYQIINEVVSELKPAISGKNLSLKVVDPLISTKVICDYYKIGQVVRNLLSNAIKFTPEEKSIEIAFKQNDLLKEHNATPFLQVSVRDQGIGIPKNELILVFDKFTQSSKTKTGAGGTGLGLSICYEIIKVHRGKIWAENNSDEGATFSFVLPYWPAIQPGQHKR